MKHNYLLGALAAAALVACGGGGSDDDTPPTASALTLQGTAATGQAIPGGAVQVKCATGSGSATTQTNGTYSVTIDGGALPCVLQVTPSGGTPLYSAIGGSGAGSVTVNITPLTELVVAKAAQGSPAGLFANFDASAQALVATPNLQTAVQAIVTALQGVVDLSGVDPIKDTLVAATAGGATGNALDQKLDTLQAALAAAQTTLTELSAAVASSGTTSAPVQTILQPAASSCAGFRSGRYVAINPSETDPAWAAHTFELNAATLTASFFDGSTVTVTDDGGCSYSIPDDGEVATRFLVSKSGLAVARDTFTSGSDAGKTDVSLVIPAQTIPLADLAGTWNALQYTRDAAAQPLAPTRVVLTIDANGQITGGNQCDSAGQCESFGSGGSFSVNSAGGFNLAEGAGDAPSRAFAFKTADGLSLFILDPNNLGMVIATKQAALTLPALDTVSNYWDFSIDATGFASALTSGTTTVTGVDANAGTFTRQRSSDARIDSFKINDPGTGLRSRAAGSCTINGAPNNCAGLVAMPLPGSGAMVYTSAAPQNFFGISINRP